MVTQRHGSVVALEYRRQPRMSFADIVEEFDIAFQMIDTQTRGLTWDCDDIAIIERDAVRVALGWLPSPGPGASCYLIVAVGPIPGGKPARAGEESYEFLSQRIIERTYEFLPFQSVLHGDANQPVGAELIDTVFDLLRLSANAMPDDSHVAAGAGPSIEDDEDLTGAVPPWMATAGAGSSNRDYANGYYAHSARATGANQYEVGDEDNNWGDMLLTRASPTQPLRLTIHTLALSMVLYLPALGAFLFAYSMLRDVFPVGA